MPKKISKETKEKYFEGIGRRKTSIARVRVFPLKEKGIVINGRKIEEYFKIQDLNELAKEPLNFLGEAFITINVKGGGFRSQAEAIRHGLARALLQVDEKLRPQLSAQGWLRRDPRMKERRKYGLKKARRAPQFSKR